jgi:hypothetical protein
MTVENQTYKVTGTGNDSATVFSFSPMVLPTATSDLLVIHVDANGVETTLTEGTGASAYSVSTTSFPGTGSVTYPEDEVTPMPTGEFIIMKRQLTLEQTTDLENQGGYHADTQETAMDKLVMIALQQQEELDRTLKLSSLDTSSQNLPPAADRAEKYAYFDAAGDLTAVATVDAAVVSAFMLTLIDDTTAAAARTTLAAQEDVITTRGDLVYGNATPAAARLAVGADNTVLKSDGTDPSWGKVDGTEFAVGSDAQGDILYYNGSAWTRLGAGTSGQFLQTQGAAADPVWADEAAEWSAWQSQDLTNGGANDTQYWTLLTGLSGVSEIEIIWWDAGITTNAEHWGVQLGTGAGPTYVTTGYDNETTVHTAAGTTNVAQTTGFVIVDNATAHYNQKQILQHLGSNTWHSESDGNQNGGANNQHASGIITLGAEATALRAFTETNDLFDNGTVYWRYR